LLRSPDVFCPKAKKKSGVLTAELMAQY